MQKIAKNKQTFWKQKWQDYRKSGLSRREFSERIGVKKTTMDYWFARIRKEMRDQKLVEVNPSSMPGVKNPLHIVVADRYRIEVNPGFDPQLLCAVVKSLESV